MNEKQGKSRLKPVIFTFVFIRLMIPLGLYSQEYLKRTYTIDDGLASPTIHDITQDSKGRMWFATPQGVTCYDGTGWENYTQTHGLPFESYYKIRADKQGNIWAFTGNVNEGISLFNSKTQQWRYIDGPDADNKNPPQNSISSIALIENRQKLCIGIGTRGPKKMGLYIYIHSYTKINDDTPPGEKGQWTQAGFIPIFGVASDNGWFYLATHQGLYRVNPDRPNDWKQVHIKTPSPAIHSAAVEKKPGQTLIWLIGKEWVGYYLPAQNRFHLLYQGSIPGFEGNYYQDHLVILPDGFGGLWAGNKYSFIQVVPGDPGISSTTRILTPLGITGGYSIFSDREANLWVGTFRGAEKITGIYFENYKKNSGFYDDEVTAVQEIDSGNMAFGHIGGFTFLIDNTIYPVEIPGIDKKASLRARVQDMCRDRLGNIWAAASYMGIVKIMPSPTIKMKWYKNLIPRDPQDYATSVLVDNRGDLWALVNDRLLKWQNNGFISPHPPLKVKCGPRRLFAGSSGTIYIATSTCGLYRLNQGVLEPILPVKDDLSQSVYSVYEDKSGRLLVGTGKGLFILQGKELTAFRLGRTRVENPVYFIMADRQGNLWIGMNNGVIRWDQNGSGQVRHYTKEDGLVGSETNRAAGFVDSSGRVWIGTESGVSCYYRERDHIKQIPPQLELLYLDAAGTTYSLERDIALEYHQDDLIFYFRGISFIDEKAVRYNLKLAGFDRQWSTNIHPTNNQVRYTNLPPGNYRFYVQAVNKLGIKSPMISSGVITIRKPFFHTWWFYSVLSAAIGFLIFFVAHFISKRQYTIHLEEQIRERTRRLEESEKELRNIFDSAHDAIIILEPHNEIVYDANDRACEIYGFSRQEFIGMSLLDISKDIEQGRQRVKEIETLQPGDYLNFETVQFRKDGSEMFLEVNASVINYRGKLAILSINRDVSRRKQAELQIKKSLQEKEILLKEIHHRVKNNLQVISSLLDLQADALGDRHISKAIQDSKDRIYSMALIHENLYQFGDLARINGSEYIHNLVGYIFGVHGDLAKNIVYRVKIETPSLALDLDTAVPIGLILTELLSNAMKHAFPPGKKGEIHIAVRPGIPGMLTLEVRDNGVGIPPELNVRESRSLGLQLVHLLTQQVKGTIEMKRNKGTTVTITFPYREHQ